MDDAQLRTVWQHRQMDDRVNHLSGPLTMLMKHTLAKKVRQLSTLAKVWDEIVPDAIADHTALEAFSNGVLTVIVDSAAHRYHLQTLLNGGLQRELQTRVSAPINKVKLVPGQFYSVDVDGAQRFTF